jgi:hypothetical protein
MKSILTLTFAMLVSASSLLGQSTDKIIKINGDTLNVAVTNVSESSVTFAYPNETATSSINRKVVQQIIYKSGRVESISEPMIIRGEADFENVIITKDPNEVLGLIKKGDVEGKAFKYFGNESKLRVTATDKLKKEAANKGAFIILIQSDNFSMSPINNVTLTGIAYGY